MPLPCPTRSVLPGSFFLPVPAPGSAAKTAGHVFRFRSADHEGHGPGGRSAAPPGPWAAPHGLLACSVWPPFPCYVQVAVRWRTAHVRRMSGQTAWPPMPYALPVVPGALPHHGVRTANSGRLPRLAPSAWVHLPRTRAKGVGEREGWREGYWQCKKKEKAVSMGPSWEALGRFPLSVSRVSACQAERRLTG